MKVKRNLFVLAGYAEMAPSAALQAAHEFPNGQIETGGEGLNRIQAGFLLGGFNVGEECFAQAGVTGKIR